MSKSSSEEFSIRVELWASAAHWNLDQMCWLALEYDPHKVKNAIVPPEFSVEQKRLAREIQDVLDTRFDGSLQSRLLSPKDAVELLVLAGIELPKRLQEAVARRAAMKTSHDRPQGAVTKELNTLRKILLAVAVEKFDHQHGKGAAGRISAAAQRRGISVSDDTVRKHLDEAMASLDQDQKADLFLRNT